MLRGYWINRNNTTEYITMKQNNHYVGILNAFQLTPFLSNTYNSIFFKIIENIPYFSAQYNLDYYIYYTNIPYFSAQYDIEWGVL